MKRLLHALAALWPEKRGEGSPPLPDTHTGILQHVAAVLRMERILGEFADSPICKTAKDTPSASVLNDLPVLDGGLSVSEREQSKFANSQIRESVAQPKNLTHISRPMPLLTIVIPVIFMCLMAAKQVSAQAEPAAAAGMLYDRTADDIITSNAISQYGMFGVHEVGDNVFLEIPDSLLGRDILAINRLAQGWAGDKPYDPFLGFIGYSGDLTAETLFCINWERDGMLVLSILDYSDRVEGDHDRPILLPNADLLPPLHRFVIVCRNRSDDAFLVDATDFIRGDNEVMTFSKTLRKKYGVGTMNSSQSSLSGIEVTGSHLVTSGIKTYAYRNGETVRMKMRSTWFLLPKSPYVKRLFDEHVGYFSQQIRVFDDPFSSPATLRMVKRWRMEPQTEDLHAYDRGDLVEPRSPIVIYIDPQMPEAWVPYMLDGINEWQLAFEKAGFKNAIRGARVPSDMKDRILGDARYSMISYKPSSLANATAELVIDPRSGEIVNVHVAWHHGVIRMLQDWLVIQGVATGKDGPAFADEALIGRMIRSLVAHEIGHSLGLLHNFGASSTVSVDKLRDAEWLSINSISPSIMDYVRINYVAQPEDSIRTEDLFPRVAEYDKWAIEWGYRYRGDAGERSGTVYTNGNKVNQVLWFGHQNNVNDPRCQAEDLGDDPVAAAHYGVENLKRVLAENADLLDQSDYSERIFHAVASQHSHYIRHATIALNGPPAKRTSALEFLNLNFFRFPEWKVSFDTSAWEGYLAKSLIALQNELFPQMIASLISQKDTASLLTIQTLIFDGGATYGANGVYTRQLQQNYVAHLNQMAIRNAGSRPATTYENHILLSILKDEVSYSIRGLQGGDADNVMSKHLETLQKDLNHTNL